MDDPTKPLPSNDPVGLPPLPSEGQSLSEFQQEIKSGKRAVNSHKNLNELTQQYSALQKNQSPNSGDLTTPFTPPIVETTNSTQVEKTIPQVKPPEQQYWEEEEDEDYEGEKPHKKRPGIGIPNPFKIFKTIKNFGCFLLLVIFGLLILLLVTIIFRPKYTWEPLKVMLNANYKPPVIIEEDIENVQDHVDSFLENGADEISLDENQTALIVRNTFGGGDQRIDIEENKLIFLVDMDTKGENPLWLMVEVQINKEGQLEVTKTGFKRLGLPSAFNSFLGDNIFRAMNLAQSKFKDQNPNTALAFLTKTNSDIEFEIKSVEFQKDKIVLNIDRK